ncbi:MAG: mandelate racemase/muconate lactonizing enzyme family protein [Burkholderiales bacterium]|nr:mandelate racemase/muconate lactonizing enzyme family protein [Burkholderiales bacterium]
MKITHLASRIVRLPAEEPLAGGPPPFGPTYDFVVLELGTDDGVTGLGLTFFGGALTGALKAAVDALGALALGMDPMRPEQVAETLGAAADSAGPGGIFTLAAAAIDIALWDIRGKALGLPVSTLLGGTRTAVPTYASGALMRMFPLEVMERSAARLVERGFTQMKMQLALPGRTTPALEVERARAIRAVVGPDVDLMCDINQRWDVRQAISLGRRLEEVNFFWLEDVVAADDYRGMARVAEALATPLAGGEYVYGLAPFRHMLEAGAVDIPMIDVLRAGGITAWMKIAALAEAFNLPVVSHLLPEIHVHMVAAAPNGLTVEYMPWSCRLFREVPVPQGGMLAVPARPGLGLEFDRDVLERYGTDG